MHRLLKILGNTKPETSGELLIQLILIGVIWFLIGGGLFVWLGGVPLSDYVSGFFTYMTQMNIFGVVVGIFAVVWVATFLWRRFVISKKKGVE